MKKNMIKIMLIILALLLLATPICTADSPLNKTFSQADDFLNQGNTSGTINEQNILDTSNLAYNILIVIGIAIALIWGLVLGMKFMTGAITEKAEVKKDILIYLFGCILIFAAPAIWKLVLKLTEDIR